MTSEDDFTVDLALSLEHAASQAKGRCFLRTDQLELGFGDVFETVRAQAHALAEHARELARPVVWLRLAPTVDSVLALATCIEAGVPFAAAHPRWTEVEAAARISALDGCDLLHLPLGIESPPMPATGNEAGAVTRSVAPHRPAAPMALVFTSGSTGTPTPVVLSRAAFVAAASASRSALPLGPKDRWLLSMPLAHVGGLGIIVRCLVARACVVLDAASFEPRAWLARVAEHRVTHASVVPTMLKRLVDAELECPQGLRYLVVGGAACDPALASRARDLGFPVRLSYGMTETCAMMAIEAAPGQGGVGRALFGLELAAFDGELAVRGPTLANGRFVGGRVEPLPVDAQGWFRTGDLGRVDAMGIVHVDGRRDDVIITGGENVHPAEVEAALLALPGVSGALVFGVDDAEWGRSVACAVVVDEPALTPTALDACLRGRIAGFKRPRAYAVLPSFPLLPSGKVDRVRTSGLALPRLLPVR